MASQIDADINVQRFGFIADESGHRLVFPQARADEVSGSAGSATYGAANCMFAGLEGRLGVLRWKADAAAVETAWFRDNAGRYELVADRIDHPRGLMLMRGADSADKGRLEIVAPEVSFSELRLTYKGPFQHSSSGPPSAESPSLRQGKLRFLDSLSGRVFATLKVQLDLPVLGERTLDQQLRVPIQNGAIDFRALEDSLHWLGGAFLDITHDADQLKMRWKVPIFGSSHDLVTWPLDEAATTIATFGRVPVRSLTDPQMAATAAATEDAEDKKEKRKILSSITIADIDIALSLSAPRHLEVGAGTIAFGGDDQPGLVDLKISGAIANQGPGALKGAIGSIDTTLKDLRIGPLEITADRLQFEGLDQIEVAFDGFHPTGVTMVIRRATATNLSLKIG